MSFRLAALLMFAATAARADGTAIVGGSPRAIGRAGAGTVGDDGGGALLINPAALARRDGARAQVGVAFVDDTVGFQSAAPGAPLSRGQGGTSTAPLVAVAVGADDWIFSAGVMTSAVASRSLARPGSLPNASLGSAFDYRYAGIAGLMRRDTAAVGAARRLTETLAVGASVSLSRVHVQELRRVWAGFGGRDAVGDPRFGDVDLAFDASTSAAPSAVAGLLYAPADSPIELGASVSWARDITVRGSVLPSVRSEASAPTVAVSSDSASLAVRQPWALRAGGRYLGDHVVAELDGEAWLVSDAASSTAWSLSGLRVIDRTGVSADVSHVPSRISQRTHVAVRSSVDLELVGGFLWATAGYAFSTGSTPAVHLSPSFSDLGGHTLGLGLEGQSGSFTVTLGWSRTWSLATSAPSALSLDNPFQAGDSPVPAGTYTGSIDQVGVLIDVEWSAP